MKNKAEVKPEILTDNSVVYNVIKDDEAIAHPATPAEADAICKLVNKVCEAGASGYAAKNQVELLELVHIVAHHEVQFLRRDGRFFALAKGQVA